MACPYLYALGCLTPGCCLVFILYFSWFLLGNLNNTSFVFILLPIENIQTIEILGIKLGDWV